MNRDDFAKFVARTIDEVIKLAEKQSVQKLPRQCAFRWLGRSHPLLRDGIVEHIVQRVWLDEDHIYPCVDIGVADLLDDGSLLIVGNIAGYAPKAFGMNWTGRDGPFIHIVGEPFMAKIAGRKCRWSPETDALDFTVPDMKRL